MFCYQSVGTETKFNKIKVTYIDESNHNISVSGFMDESPYTDPGTWLQSQQEGIETRIKKIVDRFQSL